MIRERMHIVTRDGAGRSRALETVDECNRLCGERKWPTTRVWEPVAGSFNELVLETDFPDLAAYADIHNQMDDDTNWQIIIKPLIDAMLIEHSQRELLSLHDNRD